MVKCAKLGETLPGLPYKPFNDALGQRIYDIDLREGLAGVDRALEADRQRVPARPDDKKSHEVLKEQCEDFLFGAGGTAPAEYVPETQPTSKH